MSKFFRKEILVRVCFIVFFVATILISMPGCPRGTCSGENRQCVWGVPDDNCHWDGVNCSGCDTSYNYTKQGDFNLCVDEDGNSVTNCKPDCICDGCGMFKVKWEGKCNELAQSERDCVGSCPYLTEDVDCKEI
jgi:hypothetical protein